MTCTHTYTVDSLFGIHVLNIDMLFGLLVNFCFNKNTHINPRLEAIGDFS